MKYKILQITLLSFFTSALFTNASNAQAVKSFTQGFDSVPSTWVIVNNSSPVGPNSWFQGQVNPGSSTTFSSHSGAANSYIAANYTAVLNRGTISDWLITPSILLQNGATFSFWTRTVPGSKFADRIEVRLNKTDTTANVGSDANSVGSFTDSLLSINPTLVAGGYPDSAWTQYSITLSGITGIDSGRIGIRYYVTDGGLTGTQSNYIGIDDAVYTSGILPVNFISFDGVLQNNVAVLNWSTANEVNNKGFEVERSVDGQTFNDLAFINGSGTSASVNHYSFTDAKMIIGNDYYRLKQIDLDNNFHYSAVIKLSFNKFGWSIIGNGTSNTSLQLQLDKQHNVAVQIVSASGVIAQTINKGNIGQGTYSIPLNINRASGIYFVKMIIDGVVTTKEMFK